MTTTALFIKHRALPGKREQVHQVWQKHLQPNIDANPAHEVYFHCFDNSDLDAISVYQQYTSPEASKAFLTSPSYAAYVAEVTPLLAGPPELTAATPIWTKR